MTTAELHRALADEIERREQLEVMVQRLTAELEAARAQAAAAEPKQWYSSQEAARFLGLSDSFLEKDRIQKTPRIPFCKDSPRKVSYARTDLETYKQCRMRGQRKAA